MELDALVAALRDQPDMPPIERWNPPLSGDIDILIDSQGQWFHEGSPINRDSLVKLFASILRREPDGDYVLVTPVEKWRIRVEDLPLQIVDFNYLSRADSPDELVVETNVGRYYRVGSDYPLTVDVSSGAESDLHSIPMVQLDHGVAARFSRPAYYRLIECCRQEGDRLLLNSGGEDFVVGRL